MLPLELAGIDEAGSIAERFWRRSGCRTGWGIIHHAVWG